jgi:hypothetical protein
MRAGLMFLAIAATIAASVDAQSRFRVLAVDAIDELKGLQIYTIRDEQTASCYGLVLIGSTGLESLPFSNDPRAADPDADRKIRLAHALRDLLATRDRQIAGLQSRHTDGPGTVHYESDREQIEQEYEQGVRALIPQLYPSAQVAPGWRTTSPDALNDAVRRALTEGDAVDAAAARSASDEQLRRLIASNRASATVFGPIACRTTKPR